jgi:hypothetical protein
MNLPAYGAWNVEKVAMGTGEALPGPAACEIVAGVITSYNRSEAGKSEAAVVPIEPSGQQNRR